MAQGHPRDGVRIVAKLRSGKTMVGEWRDSRPYLLMTHNGQAKSYVHKDDIRSWTPAGRND